MKMTDIMKKSHSESKSENLDAILQKIDNKAFITNSADSAHTETKPQPIKLRRKSVGIAAAAARTPPAGWAEAGCCCPARRWRRGPPLQGR